jgi:hypothetical protein
MSYVGICYRTSEDMTHAGRINIDNTCRKKIKSNAGGMRCTTADAPTDLDG